MQLCSFADVAHCKLLDNEDLDFGGGEGRGMYSIFHFLSIITKCPYILAHLAEEKLGKETFYLVYFFSTSANFSQADPFTQHFAM